jgi:hypothetical protein
MNVGLPWLDDELRQVSKAMICRCVLRAGPAIAGHEASGSAYQCRPEDRPALRRNAAFGQKVVRTSAGPKTGLPYEEWKPRTLATSGRRPVASSVVEMRSE